VSINNQEKKYSEEYMELGKDFVAVVGAGPAGIYAAKKLASFGAQVVIFNRDIKPGGLAEYGIFHSKYRMKQGLRKQFHKILSDENIRYYGNVHIGEDGDLSLDDLRQLGFRSIMVTVGAQGTKWLGLPGENLKGVFHAKDLVYHYNQLPPFSQRNYNIGKRAALIGVGNVMVDIAHWLIDDIKVDEVISVARRGPAEVKFTKKEMQNVANNLDLPALDAEIERVREYMLAVNQNPQAAKEFILSALDKAEAPISDSRFTFQFLSSPKEIISDGQGRVSGLEVEDTKLIVQRDGNKAAHRLGTSRVLDVDTVIFCIGDKVDEAFGLPTQWNAFIKHPSPSFPVQELSYEVYDPQKGMALEGVFVSGWSREASSGLVGYARKDGENGAEALRQYLETLPPAEDSDKLLDSVQEYLANLPHAVVDKPGIMRLAEIEQLHAEKQSLEDFKFGSNEAMLEVLEQIPLQA
jgi:ferredoxin/flavodoxin---NADP+ reductase